MIAGRFDVADRPHEGNTAQSQGWFMPNPLNKFTVSPRGRAERRVCIRRAEGAFEWGLTSCRARPGDGLAFG
jgi:hypothetical protein